MPIGGMAVSLLDEKDTNPGFGACEAEKRRAASRRRGKRYPSISAVINPVIRSFDFYTERAKTAASTDAAPAPLSTRAADSSVAPVVTTSSTNNTFLRCTNIGKRTLNIPSA